MNAQGKHPATGFEDWEMATVTPEDVIIPEFMKTPGVVTISGFRFDRNLITHLTGLFRSPRNDLSRFDCVKDCYGVYYFFDESGDVPYVGLSGEKADQQQDMKIRVSQHFKHSPGDTGATFWKAWKETNNASNKQDLPLYREDYKPYIERHRLGTLSIDVSDLTYEEKTDLVVVIKGMEDALICKFKPTYNTPYYRVTDNEYCEL